jgi:hypothetical protein
MTPLLDPRDGDFEDDASSTRQRSLLSLAGSLLAEISLPKLAFTWVLLVGLPGLLLGAAPLIATLWAAKVSSHAASLFNEVWPALFLLPLAAFAWFAGRPLLRLAESSFWSLHALAVQPVYVAFREGLRHLAETRLPPGTAANRRAAMRAATAAVAGIVLCAFGIACIALAWPATRWVGTLQDLAAPLRLVPALLANAVVMIAAYFAAAALVWGAADAAMDQPRDLPGFATASPDARQFRVAHLSDIHTVGEAYGFRIECGRAGPRGNALWQATLARLAAVHAACPLDVIVITGDMTDAGRSAEWAEFFAALQRHPALAALVLALPGNHDVNVVDRASPSRMDLPTSPTKRLRQLRTISALDVLQGERVRLPGGETLATHLRPSAAAIAAFADTRASRQWRKLAGLWDGIFPMIVPPETEDGLGMIVLNSNAVTHFSFTNALGLVSAEQVRAIRAVARRHPRACWVVALHHHVVEYPRRAKALSERIGTALINGTWFIRSLRPLAGRAVILHGHRHIDWIGACGDLLIVSAPSPVMNAVGGGETYFYVHTLAVEPPGRLRLLPPERIDVAAAPVPAAAGLQERRGRLSVRPA